MSDSISTDSGMAQLLLPNSSLFLLNQPQFRTASLDELMLAAQQQTHLLRASDNSSPNNSAGQYSIDTLLQSTQNAMAAAAAAGQSHQLHSQTSSAAGSPAPPMPTSGSGDDEGNGIWWVISFEFFKWRWFHHRLFYFILSISFLSLWFTSSSLLRRSFLLRPHFDHCFLAIFFLQKMYVRFWKMLEGRQPAGGSSNSGGEEQRNFI